ncbi:hypothetical protein LR48_Vigan27s000400 [Vigna angularis]|uniref:Ubiquitin-like protease family profile domain-containing protein n=1 Tax=Phaseolus angularis TaxID=3914 RepID=A0A0L9T4B7_PHAAN|nr:hypothetical protein LR48_Vigan27s000400 [Vigna angularis]
MHEPVIDENDDMAEAKDDPLTKDQYMNTIIVDQGRSSMYVFVEPQTIQPSNNIVETKQNYLQTWMTESNRDVYLMPYINGSHWQLMVIIPKQCKILWFCSLHMRMKNDLKNKLQGFVRGAHPAGRERDEEKGQQREAPVTDHVRPQVVAANANELVLDDVAGGEAVVEIGEGDVGLSLRILLSKGMSEVVTTTGKLFQFNTSANNPDVVHRKSENREPYRVFIEQPDAFSFHQRTKSPFNPFIADKQPQEKRTFFSQSSSKPLQFFNRASLGTLQSCKLLSIQIKSSQTPPHASIRKQRKGAMEEEWRREEGLAVVDEKNILDQQQQQHQWRMNISNISDEDDGGSG